MLETLALRAIHKSRGQLNGEGGYPNDHFITSPLFNKSDHDGGGGQIYHEF